MRSRHLPPGLPRLQRGNIYLGHALLAALLLLAGALLVRVHPAFVLLMPVGVLAFFLPNLMALSAWVRAHRQFRRRLAAISGRAPSVLVLRNEFRGNAAQALWVDTARRELGLIADAGDGAVRSWDALADMRAVHVPESYAVSFHQGRVRIPACHVLVFEFNTGSNIELVTRKVRRLQEWLAVLQPHLGGHSGRPAGESR